MPGALALPFGAWSQDTASSPSRAEVKQEGQAALKAGQTPVGDKVTNKPDTSTHSTKTRSQVKSETAASAGQLPHGDASATTPQSTHPAPHHSSKTRAEVKSEAQAANRQGDIPTGDLGKGSSPDIANKPSNRKAAQAASGASY